MPGRHSTSPETTSDNLFIAPEDAYRGKHSLKRRPGRGSHFLLAALAVVVVGGAGGGYVAFTLRAATSENTLAADAEMGTRAAPERASRAGGACSRTGPGQNVVETYLATQTARFGQVTADGLQDGIDCAAITRFQSWAQVPHPNGYADQVTADIAQRLAATSPASCQAPASRLTICVDLSHQTLWVMKNGRPVMGPTVIRSGHKGRATTVGRYTVNAKKADAASSDKSVRLPYWQSFNGDFGFHATDVPMYSVGLAGARGCLNLLPAEAKVLYGLTTVGTAVHVFGRNPV